MLSVDVTAMLAGGSRCLKMGDGAISGACLSPQPMRSCSGHHQPTSFAQLRLISQHG
jgi:hypothetical protein